MLQHGLPESPREAGEQGDRRDPSVDEPNQIGTRKNSTFRNRPTVTVAAALRRKLRQRACGSSGFASGSHSPRPAASAQATTRSATAFGANAIVCFAYSWDRMPRPSAIAGASCSRTRRQGTRASHTRSGVAGGAGGTAEISPGTGSCNSPIACIDSPPRRKLRRWRDAGSQRTAAFEAMLPGNYRFEMRAANGDGVWNEAGASLSVEVLPFFWEASS